MNHIHSLLDEQGNVVDPTRVKNHIASFFMRLYKDQRVKISKLDDLHFKRISIDKRAWLERSFEEGEIKMLFAV